MNRFFLICVLIALLQSVQSQYLNAQGPEERGRRGNMPGGEPPWMRGGNEGGSPPWMRGGREGGRGEGGNIPPGMGPGRDRGGPGGDRNERALGMLRSMDRNGDGKLEPSEIPEYRRNFVSGIVSRLGGDPNKTIDLNDLTKKASSSQGTTSSTPSGSSSVPSGDPLVPYFGEKEPEEKAPLGFGQREPEAKVAAAPKIATAAVSSSDQILRQAREIMNKYDKNKNGTLDKDKGEWVSSLPFNADRADKNRDGRISMAELMEALGGKTSGTTGAATVATKQSMAYDRLPQGVPNWFFERDKDQDGQLTMLEYANGKPWTEAIVDEFRFLDKNNDGIATVAEVFETLKQVDEEKRLKTEKEKREQERRKGIGANLATDAGKSESNSDDKNRREDGPRGSRDGSGGTRPDDKSSSSPPGEGSPKPSQEASSGNNESRSNQGPPDPSRQTDSTPNWKPAERSSEIPASAPYSSGSSESNRRGGNDSKPQRTRGSRR